MLFAAAHPERTAALILQGAEVRERTRRRTGRGASRPTRSSRRPWRRSPSAGARASASSHRAERRRAGVGVEPGVARVQLTLRHAGRSRGLHAHGVRDRRPARGSGDQRPDADRPRRPTTGLPRRERPLPRSHDPRCEVRGARQATTTFPGSTPTRRSPRSASSSPGSGRRRRPIAMLATVLFTDLVGSTAACGGARRSPLARPARAAPRVGPARARSLRRRRRSTRRATASSRRSTGLRARSGVRRRSSTPCDRSASTFEPACIRARSSSPTARSQGSPSTSARASRRRPSGGEVLVSGTVKDLVAGSGLEFEDRGTAALKGIPGEWRLFAVAR